MAKPPLSGALLKGEALNLKYQSDFIRQAVAELPKTATDNKWYKLWRPEVICD